MGQVWNEKYKWCFSDLGSGQRVGINDAGIGIFKKNPYIGLAKEILQNIIDAKDEELEGEPARAHFKLVEVDKQDFPGRERLLEVINLCSEYYNSGDDGEKMQRLKDNATEILENSDKIKFLKISDYKTKGLMGSHEEKGSNWTGLVREISATNKGNDKSGSFGVGKFAPFNFSKLRTIIYSTLNKDEETALQGKTILTSFRDTDGKLKQNVGLFGEYDETSNDCLAIYDMNNIPEIFKRNEIGTDLFIAGFKEEEDWKEQIIISVLEYFFYTIYLGNLEVIIEDSNEVIEINKNNIGELINEYEKVCEEKEINFSAPIFWKVMNDNTGNKKVYKKIIRNKGEIELHLLVDNKLSDKRILEMRKPGMKIQEDNRFRLPINFCGILIATGDGSISNEPKDNINSFLRKCENQSHSVWSFDEYEEEKKEAKLVLKDIHKWIADKVKEQMPQTTKKEVDAFGLNDYLASSNSDNDDLEEEAAFLNFKPLTTELKSQDSSKNDISKEVLKYNDEGELEVEEPGEEEPGEEEPGEEEPGEEEPGEEEPGEEEPGEEEPGEEEPGEEEPGEEEPGEEEPGEEEPGEEESREKEPGKRTKKRIMKRVELKSIKTPYNNATGMYKIIIVPDRNCKNAYIQLKIGSDDNSKFNAEILSASIESKKLEIRDKLIYGVNLRKDKKTILDVKINSIDKCLLEVSAYA